MVAFGGRAQLGTAILVSDMSGTGTMHEVEPAFLAVLLPKLQLRTLAAHCSSLAAFGTAHSVAIA